MLSIGIEFRSTPCWDVYTNSSIKCQQEKTKKDGEECINVFSSVHSSEYARLKYTFCMCAVYLVDYELYSYAHII